MPRIAPAEAPYEPAIADRAGAHHAARRQPLVLFRTMARSPRVFAKMFAGGLLDKGPLSLRQREIVIDRTTARLGGEYEWGVHVAFFAEKVGFGAEEIAATVHGPADAACWSAEEQALLAAGRRPGRPPHDRRRHLDVGSPRISTRHRSSRRSRWWATTTRSASSAAASSCRSKTYGARFPAR